MDKQLSIIIPHYNTPDLLKRLLDSIVSEKRNDTEVIVVDDHSTRTEEYQEIKRQFPEVLFYTNHPQKKNAGAARNVGIDNATGKWILFADADDAFLPGWYHIVSEYFEQLYDIVFFSPIGKGVKEGRIKRKYEQLVDNYIKDPSETNENMIRYCFHVPWSKLLRREIIVKKHIRFDEVRYGNDVLFSARCGAAADTIHADNRTIYCSIESQASLTSDKSEKVFTIRSETMCRCYSYVRQQIGAHKAKKLNTAILVFTCLNDIRKRKFGIKCTIDHISLFLKYRIPLSPSIKYALGKAKNRLIG